MRLRILEAFQPPDGGLPEHVRALATGLVASDHEVTVTGPADAVVRADLESAGARFEPIDLRGRFVAPGPDRRALDVLGVQLRDGGFDLVHAHGQKAGLLARLAARRADVPAIYTPHCLVYRTQVARPRPGAAARARLGLAMERALGRRTAAIVAVAEEERLAAVADGLAPKERVVTILNGVMVDGSATPDPELVAFRAEGPLLGFVSALRDQKGLATLLDALERLGADGQALRFAIVGNGPLREEVVRRLAGSALESSTRLVPFGGRSDPYLAALDGFVLPSYWEGMPIALLEAMAMGLPAVASAVGGIPEAVVEGETGLLVPPRDAAALARALRQLAAMDAEERSRMGAAAAARARERFSVKRMVAQTATLYASVAAGEPPTTPA